MTYATNAYSDILTAIIMGGIVLLILIVVVSVIVNTHVAKGNSVIPWGHRKRVERAKADKEIAVLRYDHELAEMKHLALQPIRNKLMANIENDTIQPLKELLAGESASSGDEIRKAAWGEEPRSYSDPQNY